MEKDGDVISLVQELLNCNAYEAAKQINEICNCGVDFKTSINKNEIEKYRQKQKVKEEFKNWLDDTYNVLTDYYKEIVKIYNKATKIDYFENMEFVEACMNKDKIEAWLDILFNGTDEEKIWLWKNYRKEVDKINGRLRRTIA